MRARVPHLLGLALAAAFVVVAVAVPGLGTGLLLLSPALVLLVPLLAGRYLGEASIARLAARAAAPRRRRTALAARPADRPARAVRGGLLLAASLAERGPPARDALR